MNDHEKEMYTLYSAAALAGLSSKMQWPDATLYADLAARKMVEYNNKFYEEKNNVGN